MIDSKSKQKHATAHTNETYNRICALYPLFVCSLAHFSLFSIFPLFNYSPCVQMHTSMSSFFNLHILPYASTCAIATDAGGLYYIFRSLNLYTAYAFSSCCTMLRACEIIAPLSICTDRSMFEISSFLPFTVAVPRPMKILWPDSDRVVSIQSFPFNFIDTLIISSHIDIPNSMRDKVNKLLPSLSSL